MKQSNRWCLGFLIVLLAALPAQGAAPPPDTDTYETLEEAVHRALGVWSRFAATGDLEDVGSSFISGGPQWSQFRSEAEGGEKARLARLEARRLRVRSVEESRATVWAEVEASRSGFRSEIHAWDFDLIYRGSEWRVWTVVAAEEPTGSIEVQAQAVEPNTTSPPPARLPVVEQGEVDSEPTAAEPVAAEGTRIPALSAWVIVVTLVGVAAAGYMAPRIDRRGDR